jgi:spore coat protein U-like protein
MYRNFMRKRRIGLIGVLAAGCLLQSAEAATTTTTTFQVSVTLTATCTINSAGALNFGPSVGILNANVDQSSAIQVTCSNSTPYTIGLDAGQGSGATVATRKLTGGSVTINYTLYSDSSHSVVWGNGPSDLVSGTGNGTSQSYTVFGRIPTQTTPAPGTYVDTITVTVSY